MSGYKIRNDKELETALERLDELWSVREGDDLWTERQALVDSIEAYEDENAKISPPDPVDAIKFRMEQQGLRPKDLIPYIGSAPKVSELLAGKRGLSKKMIINLHEGLGIPLESLLGVESASPLPTAAKVVTAAHTFSKTLPPPSQEWPSAIAVSNVSSRKSYFGSELPYPAPQSQTA